ncbi:transposase [Bacteroidetes bacterium endosymbiont of Geopemphigus sp.]|uniref:transposase n=1 Tax=Bacteroidetes bacterium endosymbiont of Geopemphigus sp. TaxID=2047937 RepID=UPI000CD22F04
MFSILLSECDRNRFIKRILQSAYSYSCFITTQAKNRFNHAYISIILQTGESAMLYTILNSTKIAVCYNKCIHSNKVFSGIAIRGKTSVGCGSMNGSFL